MSLEAALVARITSDGTVAAILGTRLYPDIVPQDAVMPAGFYSLISNPVVYAHDGEAMDMPLMQVSIFTEAKDTMVSLREAIRARVSGFRGESAGEQIDRVAWRELVNTFDTETGLYECVVELRMMRRP